MSKAISLLQECRKSLLDEVKAVDEAICSVQSAALEGSAENPAIAILKHGRGRLQAQLVEIERAIANVMGIVNGNSNETSFSPGRGDVNRAPEPGQYSGLKLSTAVQAYLSERGRGPVLLAKVVQDLTIAGVLVGKHGELPDTRDLRLLCANNRARFSYDPTSDTITLRSTPGNDTGKNVAGRGVVAP